MIGSLGLKLIAILGGIRYQYRSFIQSIRFLISKSIMDYKKTLNLPVTDFSMKAGLTQSEPIRLAAWEQMGLYDVIRQHCRGRPHYIVHDGPPYANAAIHLGTALNKVLKDIVVKSKTLSGFDAPYVPGWDCHGLPIELHVEKKVGKPGRDLTPAAFRQACRDFAAEQVAIQKTDFRRLGVVGDWHHPYQTMDFSYEANEIRALAHIIDRGHLERGQKPVHWCTACGSALAEAEVEYQDKQSPAIDVSFDVINTADLRTAFGVNTEIDQVAIPIWTTTPWTLPANQAVALNADYQYVLVRYVSDDVHRHLVIAADLLAAVLARYGVTEYEVLGSVLGTHLSGLSLQHPFLDRRVPIVLGDHVTLDAGTGAVHTAPAHGVEDYRMGQLYQLPMDCLVDEKSCFFENTPVVGGLPVAKAHEPVIEVLKTNGHLLHEATVQHSYPHCWRHKKPLIFRSTPQWFLSMEKEGLREQALAAIDTVTWIPNWGVKRIQSMIASRPDWCISRQRTWGVPMTLWCDQKTGALHPQTPKLMSQVADCVEVKGVDAWYEPQVDALITDGESYHKMTDTLDVWFDSGVSHYCVLEARPGLHVPADLYLEGSDQHRGWFQTSLLTSVAMHGTAPFKAVLTHGYVVDAQGYKMSKSLGNTISPQDVIAEFGADILRLWVASSDFTGDVKVSNEIFKRCVDGYRRIRNTARFLLSNLNDFDQARDGLPANELVALDQWAVVTAKALQDEIISAYETFQFQNVYQMIHHFCSVELGSFYLDVIKDRLYTAKKDSLARRSAQTAMYHILEALVRWVAPILSFTADEIWEHMPAHQQQLGAVFYDRWYTDWQDYPSETAWDWGSLIEVRSAVNKVLEMKRQAGEIGSGLDATVTLYATGSLYELLTAIQDELRFILITSDAAVEAFSAATEVAILTDLPDLKILVSVSAAEKCERCWQRRPDVGSVPEYETICGRCVINIVQSGEHRHFA